MHDAFEYASILERLPLAIESIASYGKTFIMIINMKYKFTKSFYLCIFIFSNIKLRSFPAFKTKTKFIRFKILNKVRSHPSGVTTKFENLPC